VKASVAGECTGFEGLNSSRATGGLWRKTWAKSLKESELISSGEIVPLKYSGTGSGGIRTERSCGAEEIQEEENRRLEIAVENSEIPLTVRSWRSRGEVNPSAIAYRHSAFGEVIFDPLKSRVAISRVIWDRRSERDRWHEIP
jgi:hypothetical protein